MYLIIINVSPTYFAFYKVILRKTWEYTGEFKITSDGSKPASPST